jgi:Arc/MetJ-type ribon-helix-helix transcriptional regulator
MEIELKDQLKKRIAALVKAGVYKDVNTFINSAAETLLMAEERTKMFSLPKLK